MEKEKVLEILEGIKRNDEYSLTYTFNGGDLVVKVTPFISYGKRMSLINDVANFVFEKTDDGIMYLPNLYELGVRLFTIVYFTDIDILSYSMDSISDILFNTTLYRDVCDKIAPYTRDIWDAITELITERKEQLRNADSFGVKLSHILDKLTQNIKEMPPEQIAEIISKFQSLNLPKDVTQEGLVKAILNQNNAENN